MYFDNESLELYHGRLDKKPGAIAMRIRWYGSGEPKLCFVERKTHRESWKGEESVKERFTLPEPKVVPYLEGSYTVEQFQADLRAKVGWVGQGVGCDRGGAVGEIPQHRVNRYKVFTRPPSPHSFAGQEGGGHCQSV